MGDRFTLSLRAYRWVAYGALATLVLIVLSGAGVRLTGSGLGCPSWPDCSGTFLPELSSHVWIEYGNRLFSTVVGIACIAAGVLAFRVRPFRADLVRPALVLAGGVVAQGLLGGLTVALDLSWPVVIAHYLLSMTLLVAGAVLVWRVRRDARRGGAAGDRSSRSPRALLVAYGGVVIVAGTFATAAGPHAGGAGTGDVVERLDAFGAGTLKTLIHLHGHMATALGVAALGLWAFARIRRAGPALMRALTVVCLLVAAQGIVGLIQYHNALPASARVGARVAARRDVGRARLELARRGLARGRAGARVRGGGAHLTGVMPVLALRYGLPAVLVIAGFVILFTVDGNLRWDGWAMCVGSAGAILLLNVLFRFGAQGRPGARPGDRGARLLRRARLLARRRASDYDRSLPTNSGLRCAEQTARKPSGCARSCSAHDES